MWARGGRLRPVVVADLVLAAVIVVQVVLLSCPRRPKVATEVRQAVATGRSGWRWEERFALPLPAEGGSWTAAAVVSGKRALMVSEGGGVLVYDMVRRTLRPLKVEPPALAAKAVIVRRGVLLYDRGGQVLFWERMTGRVRRLVPPAAMRNAAGVRLFHAGRGRQALTAVDAYNRVVAVEAGSGAVLWAYADASDTVLATAVPFRRGWGQADGLVFVSQDGTATALDGASGWALWRMPLQERVVLPAVTGNLWGGVGEEILVLGLTKAFGLGTDGRLLWSVELPTAPTGETVSEDLDGDGRREVAVACGDGSVVALDAAGRMRTLLERRGPEAWPARLAVAEVRGERRVKRRVRLVLALYGDGLVRVAGPAGEMRGWTMSAAPAAGWVRLGRRLIYVGRDGVLREGRVVWR